MPLMSSNIAAGAGAAACCAASSASRSASTALICSSSSSSRSSSRLIWALRCAGKRTAIARLQLVEPFPPIAAQRLVAGYALGEQQSFDAIDVLDPLGDQHLALAAEAAAVFFLGRRRLDHRAHPRFAALVGQQRANQRLAVDPVGLRPPPPARCRNRGRIDDMAFDPFALQHPMNPEAVQTRLPG